MPSSIFRSSSPVTAWRGVQARQLREPVVDQAEKVIEPVEPPQKFLGAIFAS